MLRKKEMRWDIFCRVIDNFGDIGVCWRLARQLVAEHGLQVRLWVDDLPSLHHICPDADPGLEVQTCSGVEIRRWSAPFPEAIPAAVVIEAFACELPDQYLATMAQREPRPVWINLEYLSAETWVDSHHGLPSPHPRLPLTKYFFFPGFTPAAGGLLRESSLLRRRDTQQRNTAELWQALGLPAPAEDEIAVSLFCYDTAPLPALLDAWAAAARPVRCLVPEGKALSKVAACFGRSSLTPGDTLQRGNLTLHVLPFMPQEDYDLLLWACDCNFVRGEDSFVRAQWAAKPMVWQIYPQQENAHHIKLDAFLDLYCSDLAEDAATTLRAFHHGWNNQGPLCWDDFRNHHTALQAHAAAWAGRLAEQSDLASKLVIFCKNRV
ncbi:MAG TPA: elongation factor P maturation arginine rhamnosyltransferase EarP [Methylophilaceae bacterium]|nr:elongation factor P maturation arginine rhamnosyltransferase EarP [Methylophilaceae bacterium]